MSEEKKILIHHDTDDDDLDIKSETTDSAQDEWVEKLDEESLLESPVDDAEVDNIVQQDTEPQEIKTTEQGVEAQQLNLVTDEGTMSPQEAEALEGADEAVDEIVAQEADRLMRADDDSLARQFTPAPKKCTVFGKIKNFFGVWWQNTRLRYATLIGMFMLASAAMLVPQSRYWILNTAGVRVEASMVVVDSESGRPLKNILVNLQGNEQRTNDDGYVGFKELKQGSTALKIERKGFATFDKNIALGWGTNPLGEQSLLATGARFRFVLKDWQSGVVINDAEAVSGEYVGQADDAGTVELVMGEVGEADEIVLSAKGYRDERRTIAELKEEIEDVTMVPGKKHAFVSNRDGEYDLYTIDVDGDNEAMLLRATRKEREVPFVLPHQARDVVAYVSSRDGDTNKDGFILDGLFVIDTRSAETYKVTRSEQLQLIGWSGNKLVYVAIIEGVSAGNSQRSKIVSYDLDTKERTELAASNYFNDVKLVGDTVYYAGSSYAVPRAQVKLFSIDPDGKNKKTIVDEQVWSIARTEYDTLLFNTESSAWYEQKIGGEPSKLDAQPAQQESKIYTQNPSSSKAVWVDTRDGKGVLLAYDVSLKKEAVVTVTSGLTDPVYWVSDTHVVYRVATSQETADYIINLAGGEAKKIADVVGNRSRYFY